MDKKYVELFKQLAQATAVSAEQVMEYDKAKGDENALNAATTMRDNYQELFDIIKNAGNEYVPNKLESARLLIGAMVQVKQLQDRMDVLKKAMAGYQTDIVPKLQEIVDNAENDDIARQMANEKFIIQEEE